LSRARWLAAADSVTADAEAELLRQSSSALELDTQTAETLRAEVAAICAERSQYLLRSEQLPWWEELGVPVRRMLDRARPVSLAQIPYPPPSGSSPRADNPPGPAPARDTKPPG